MQPPPDNHPQAALDTAALDEADLNPIGALTELVEATSTRWRPPRWFQGCFTAGFSSGAISYWLGGGTTGRRLAACGLLGGASGVIGVIGHFL